MCKLYEVHWAMWTLWVCSTNCTLWEAGILPSRGGGAKGTENWFFYGPTNVFLKLYLNKLHDSCDYQLICPEIPQCFLSRTLPYFHKFEVCHRALEWFHADDPRGQVITQVYEWENSQKLWSVNELNVSFTAGFSLLIILLLSKYMSFISNVTSLSGDSTCLSRF